MWGPSHQTGLASGPRPAPGKIRPRIPAREWEGDCSSRAHGHPGPHHPPLHPDYPGVGIGLRLFETLYPGRKWGTGRKLVPWPGDSSFGYVDQAGLQQVWFTSKSSVGRAEHAGSWLSRPHQLRLAWPAPHMRGGDPMWLTSLKPPLSPASGPRVEAPPPAPDRPVGGLTSQSRCTQGRPSSRESQAFAHFLYTPLC